MLITKDGLLYYVPFDFAWIFFVMNKNGQRYAQIVKHMIGFVWVVNQESKETYESKTSRVQYHVPLTVVTTTLFFELWIVRK